MNILNSQLMLKLLLEISIWCRVPLSASPLNNYSTRTLFHWSRPCLLISILEKKINKLCRENLLRSFKVWMTFFSLEKRKLKSLLNSSQSLTWTYQLDSLFQWWIWITIQTTWGTKPMPLWHRCLLSHCINSTTTQTWFKTCRWRVWSERLTHSSHQCLMGITRMVRSTMVTLTF